MFAIVSALLRYLLSCLRPKHDLVLENLALRHQIALLKRSCCFGKHVGAIKTSRRALSVASGRRSVLSRCPPGSLSRYPRETAPARNSRVTTGLDAPALPWRGVRSSARR